MTHAPWSAPLYDQVNAQPRSKPELYCMSSGDGRLADGTHGKAHCSCFTEQATRYVLDQQTCYAVVEQGGVYNPYREPQSAVGKADRDPRSSEQSIKNAPSVTAIREDAQASYGSMRNKDWPSYTFVGGM